jgi:hypothetical protein
MSNDVVAFKSWLDAYGLAWENRNPEAAAELFAENGTYQVTPFLEPMCRKFSSRGPGKSGYAIPSRSGAIASSHRPFLSPTS